jgi:hypothetical protein
MHWFAQTTAPWTLFGIIVVSALGALVMCLLVFRYGFPTDEPWSRDAVLITRVGHAFAGACFVISMLLVIVLIAPSLRPVPPPVSPTAAVAPSDLEHLRLKLAATEAQLAGTDGRLNAAAAEAEAERNRLADLESRLRAAERSLHRSTEDAARALAATKQFNARPPSPPPGRGCHVASARDGASDHDAGTRGRTGRWAARRWAATWRGGQGDRIARRTDPTSAESRS